MARLQAPVESGWIRRSGDDVRSLTEYMASGYCTFQQVSIFFNVGTTQVLFCLFSKLFIILIFQATFINWHWERGKSPWGPLFLLFFHWLSPWGLLSCMTSFKSSFASRSGIHGLKLWEKERKERFEARPGFELRTSSPKIKVCDSKRSGSA